MTTVAMKHAGWIAVLLAVLAWAAPARAQAGDTAVIRRQLAGPCPGGEVRLALASADTVRGYCGFIEDSRLLVRRASDEWRVPLEQVEALWVRRRGTASGARTGAIIGGVTLGAFGLLAGPPLCDAWGCGSGRAVLGLTGAVLGALGGAGIGGLIGSTVNTWDQRYPTSRR
jgi:hypothetical protein